MAAYRMTLGQPWAPLNTISPCSVCRRPEGREGGVRSLGEWDRGEGRVVGPWPRLHFLFHPFCCVPSSQGASGLPGSTGQKVMGLELGEWVPGREVCGPYRHEE